MSKESVFFVKRQQFPSINNNVCIDSEHAEHVHCVCALCVCVRLCVFVSVCVCVWVGLCVCGRRLFASMPITLTFLTVIHANSTVVLMYNVV